MRYYLVIVLFTVLFTACTPLEWTCTTTHSGHTDDAGMHVETETDCDFSE